MRATALLAKCYTARRGTVRRETGAWFLHNYLPGALREHNGVVYFVALLSLDTQITGLVSRLPRTAPLTPLSSGLSSRLARAGLPVHARAACFCRTVLGSAY